MWSKLKLLHHACLDGVFGLSHEISGLSNGKIHVIASWLYALKNNVIVLQ